MRSLEGSVYIACALTALACSALLMRGWLHSRVSLLLWTSLFFGALALENLILFVDIVVTPEYDLALFRNLTALCGVMVLVVGLVWETK